jgi:hypothetical protein
LVYPSALLFPNSYIILYWKFYFLPFPIHAQKYGFHCANFYIYS